jgi:hypothetical protein
MSKMKSQETGVRHKSKTRVMEYWNNGVLVRH